MVRYIVAVVLVGGLLASCVARSKYNKVVGALESTRVEARGRLKEQASTLESLQQQVEVLQETVLQLQERNAMIMKDKAFLDASAAELARALEELQRRKAASDARIQAYRALIKRLQRLIDAGRLRVKIVDGRLVVELASDILFPSGIAELSEPGYVSLVEVGAALAELPDRDFQVEGHTDNVPIKSAVFPSNWALGSARAVSVVRALHEGGVALDRLSAASYAAHRPVASNDTPEGRASNRRIEIVVVPDLSLLPGSQELEQL